MDSEKKVKVKEKIKFAFKILLAIAIALLLSGICYLIVDKVESDKAKEQYYSISENNVQDLFDISDKESLFFDGEACKKFEQTCLGNTNSNLISFGTFCEKDGVVCLSKENTLLIVNGNEIAISESPSSYINIINDTIFYRDDMTRSLFSYSIKTKESECIVKKQCGQVVVSKKGIYYIDLLTQKLNCISFETKKTTQLSDLKVKTFAVVGDMFWVLTTDGEFGSIKSKGSFSLITTDVDSFLCEGKIAIQKGTNIYVIDRKNYVRYNLLDIEGELVGFDGKEVYINENQTIKAYDIKNIDSSRRISTISNEEILKAFYPLVDRYEIITCEKDDFLTNKNYITIKR